MPRQKRAASKPSNHRRHWTGREKRELWRLHEAGASNGDIAAALGRTKQSVNDMVHGLGKRRRKPRAVVVLPRRSRTPLLIAAALAACIATGSIWWVLQ
jgi:IS30 family transposase